MNEKQGADVTENKHKGSSIDDLIKIVTFLRVTQGPFLPIHYFHLKTFRPGNISKKKQVKRIQQSNIKSGTHIHADLEIT